MSHFDTRPDIIHPDRIQHIIPAAEIELHTLDEATCSCEPLMGLPCDECEDSTGGPENCWKCQETGMLDMRLDSEPPFLVHHWPITPLEIEPYRG